MRHGRALRIRLVAARVAIIGAGPAGLAALRALTAAGIDAVAYERGARVGGVWTLERRPTAAYRTLHLITSRARTEFSEHPMPPGTPDYPSRDQVGEWLEAYVDRFGLRDSIRLSSEVTATRRLEGGGWEVEVAGANGAAEAERYDGLVVASGHNEVAKWPDPPYPGSDEFAGEQLHALDYDDATDLGGKNVLIVGMGNSAMDIATDVSHFAARTLLSVRHGSWIIPKRMLGKPADQVIRPWAAVHVPWRIRQPIAQTLLKLTVGKPEDIGLPAPTGGLFQSHPTISDTIVSRIAHGEITPKPGIASLERDAVVFTDGSREPCEVIIWCTGYRVTIPFLDDSFVGPDPQELPLYKRILHMDTDDLFFIGLMQSTGSAFPILERQSTLLAEHLTARWAPPAVPEMRADAKKRRKLAHKRWGDHGRPTMRVDFDAYMHELGEELEAGRARAADGSGRPLAQRTAAEAPA
jgi:cation diffusion facilitator CzcD-associated flavoprotein CzcO